jgi:3-methyladenine DNA glycosylase AlkD
MTKADEILEKLHAHANPANVEGMRRYGINSHNTLGVSMPVLRQIAKEIGRDQELAQQLWESGVHEARILASLVGEPAKLTPDQMDAWAAEIDSWDVCDQLCNNLFRLTPYAYTKAIEWSCREEEFVKRAGFVSMASLAVHARKLSDREISTFFPYMIRAASDERNFVKKAVNWALRSVGKRNRALNILAIEAAHQIAGQDSPSAHWIASDAIRELTGEKVRARLG